MRRLRASKKVTDLRKHVLKKNCENAKKFGYDPVIFLENMKLFLLQNEDLLTDSKIELVKLYLERCCVIASLTWKISFDTDVPDECVGTRIPSIENSSGSQSFPNSSENEAETVNVSSSDSDSVEEPMLLPAGDAVAAASPDASHSAEDNGRSIIEGICQTLRKLTDDSLKKNDDFPELWLDTKYHLLPFVAGFFGIPESIQNTWYFGNAETATNEEET